MSEAGDRAAGLRAQADQLDETAKLEDAMGQAKQAYQGNRDDPKAKAAHREASQALTDHREAARLAADAREPEDGEDHQSFVRRIRQESMAAAAQPVDASVRTGPAVAGSAAGKVT